MVEGFEGGMEGGGVGKEPVGRKVGGGGRGGREGER